METTLFKHPKLYACMKSGSEGPSYDPYAYNELTIETPTTRVTLHEGLAHWCDVEDLEKKKTVRHEPANSQEYGEGHLFDHLFVEACGFTPTQIDRISRKSKSVCPAGGCHELEWFKGYPGEEIAHCTKCNQYVDYMFNYNAII